MKFFKNTTWALPVIMGRKTFESIGSKPLPGRKNIVITRQIDWDPGGVLIANSMDRAMEFAGEMDVKELFVIGGAEIYRQVFDQAQRIYMTRVHASFDADAFFPEVNENKWELISSVENPSDEKHAYTYTFQVWERK